MQFNQFAAHALARWRLLLALIVVALAAVWFVPAWLLGPQVPVADVVRKDLVQTVVASGHVEAPHRTSVGTQIVGTVARIPVSEGQAVSAGQVLIELESTELRATLAQAQVAVAQAQARLRQVRELQMPVAEQSLRQAQVTLENASAQFARQQDLFRQGFIGQAALDDARKAVDLAEAQVNTARDQLQTVRPAGSDFAMAQTALEQARATADAARARLAYATIHAPVDGVLINRDVEPGDVVQPGKALMVLSPTGETQLVVQIDEKNLGRLAVGQSAIASADAFPDRRFAAEVVYVNPGVDAQRGTVEVKLRVPKPPNELRQDMTVSVDIETARSKDALLVPADSVHDAESAKPWVLVVEQGRARRRDVVLGPRGNGVAEVRSGLRAGEQVVPLAAAGVRDGSRLRAIVAAP